MSFFKKQGRSLLAASFAAAAVFWGAGAAAGAEWKDTADAGLVKQIPKGYAVTSDARGDLNGDGADDRALVILGVGAGGEYGLLVFFKEGGGWRLAAENRGLVGPAAASDCGNCPEGDKTVSCEIKKGVLHVASSYQGAHTDMDAKCVFRYRNSEFELIGYDLVMARDRWMPLSGRNVSINFPAKKMLERECAVDWDCGGDSGCRCPKYKESWSAIAPKGAVLLKKMSWSDWWEIEKLIK